MSKIHCKECRYYQSYSNGSSGECRKSLPIHVNESLGEWPCVHPAHWCGEAKPLESEYPEAQHIPYATWQIKTPPQGVKVSFGSGGGEAKPIELNTELNTKKTPCLIPNENGLFPCPFCGGTTLYLSGVGYLWYTCSECRSDGPFRKTKTGAKGAWNRRAK